MKSIDNAARQRRDDLVEAHLHIVEPIARRLLITLPITFELEDLIAQGNLGLVKAADRYDPARHDGAPFDAYARHVVRGSMLDSVRRRNWVAATAPRLEDAPEPTAMPSYDQAIDQRDREISIVAYFEGLPERERIVMEAYYVESEPTLRDVARTLEISIHIVTRLHQKAVRRIREQIDALDRAA